VRNVDGFFNKKRLIEHIVEVKYLLSVTQKEDRDQCNWWSEVECYFGNIIACLPQSWDCLDNRRDENDEMSIEVW